MVNLVQVIRSRRCDLRWVVGRQQRRPIGDAEKQRSDAVELLLREADEVIQEFVLEGPDEVLRISIRHRSSGRRAQAAHFGCTRFPGVGAELGVPVVHQEPGL